MKKDIYLYPAIFDYASDGISIEFPDLPGCFSCADTDEEALHNAKDAMRGWLLLSEEDGDPIPEPTSLCNVHISENQRVVLVEVNLALYRKSYRNRSVKKTLTIPAWLNDAAMKEGFNFSEILQDALSEKLHNNL